MRTRRRLSQMLAHNVNSFEASHADAPIVSPNPGTQLAAASGNPQFTAQFDVNFTLLYATLNTGTGAFTLRDAAYMLANAASLATKLPFFLFGNSDFSGGFARLRSAFPLQVWQYGTPFVYGTQATPTVAGAQLTSTITDLLVPGDLVMPFTAVVGGVTYTAYSIIRCTQVAYGTLLAALSSDTFKITMIRYILPDTTSTYLRQYANNINIFDQSLFGKFDSDFVSPNSFKLPEQMQDGVIDVPLIQGVDKQISLACLQNYDAVSIQWSIFATAVTKIRAF